MKILSRSFEEGAHSPVYVCEVSHTELEKFMNQYYNRYADFGLEFLSRGDTLDLGKGHDFHRETVEAIKKTQEFLSANGAIVEALLHGFQIFNSDSANKEPANANHHP